MKTQKLLALLPDLASFIIVVNQGSFTAAAKQLNVTPSALSKLITRLEKALEVRLLERTTRQLIITASGRKVYDLSVTMLNAAQQAVDSAKVESTQASGRLIVSAPEAFLYSVLQPYVVPFLAQFPQIQLHLRSIDGPVDFFNQGIDIAFRLTDKPDEHLVMKEVCQTHLVLCASPEYLAKQGVPTHPEQLVDHDCLYLAENDRDNLWHFWKEDKLHSVSVAGRFAVNHSQIRLKGVQEHLGIGIFHDFVVRDALSQGQLIRVLPDWTLQSSYHGAIGLQYPRNQYMPKRVRLFINYVMDTIAPKLQQGY
ncbi:MULTISPECIES: LysR family transcriptional regulator [unclassified Vibrio]|uniref:LysR substrate-binding domain-containing protein n=1 Tax=Vibrio sp. HB236076 TaxID=3232307 RepID=A0AB39HMB0_9VIBR|nr:LysR family transcriptional regulator [Vibrio sp. HB161653]MDP5253268.1 LysR family transcriptional regulator [Vibrio sp. HB161653]